METSRFRNLEDLLGQEELTAHKFPDPRKDLAYLCYSSGTTGLAKGVMTTGELTRPNGFRKGYPHALLQPADSINATVLSFSLEVYNMTSVLQGAHYLPGDKDDISFAFLPFSVSRSASHRTLMCRDGRCTTELRLS